MNVMRVEELAKRIYNDVTTGIRREIPKGCSIMSWKYLARHGAYTEEKVLGMDRSRSIGSRYSQCGVVKIPNKRKCANV